MTVYRIRFEGPAALAVSVATALADADGVELVSSEPLANLDDGRIGLAVTVEGAVDAVADAVANIRAAMASDASIDVTEA